MNFSRSLFPRHPGFLLLLGALLGISLLYVILGLNRLSNWPPVRSDGEGYYAYLPMLGIHQHFDLSVLRPFHEGNLPAGSWLVPNTSHYHIKYPIGVALCQLPFFLPVHWVTLLLNPEQAQGYSLPYQLVVTVSGTFHALLGVWALFCWLQRRFTTEVVLWSLVFTALGTSLAHYASYDAFASHVYTFAWLCVLLDQLDRWSFVPGWKRSIFLGFVFGLLFCIRNYSLMFGLLFFPALAHAWPKIPRKELAVHLVLMAGASLLTVLPQLALWKYSTGHWLSYSYGEEKFLWSDPHFFDVLLSVRKGVLFYTPGLALGVGGLVWFILSGREKALGLISLVCLILTYLVASFWSTWPFGGSFGHRAFVDVYPLVALGLAFLLEGFFGTSWKKNLQWLLYIFITLNLIQMGLYWCGYLKSDHNTWQEYGQAYLRPVLFLRDFSHDLRHPNSSSRITDPNDLGGVLTLTNSTPHSVKPEQPVPLSLHLENRSPWIWKHQGRPGGVKIVLRWVPLPGNSAPLSSPVPQRLPRAIQPGESLVLNLTLPAPSQPGSYFLQVGWEITSIGSTPSKVVAKVQVVEP